MNLKGIRKIFFISMTVLLITLLMLSGCGNKPAEAEKKAEDTEQKAAEDEVIRIGVYEPMTGASAAGGQMTVEGIELAKEMYRNAGKGNQAVHSRQQTDKTESANAVARLIEKTRSV